MTWTRVRQEVRQMRLEELYERRQRRTLTLAEAGEMLGVTERTFRHWSGRYHAEGAGGCRIDGSAGSQPVRCRSMRRCVW